MARCNPAGRASIPPVRATGAGRGATGSPEAADDEAEGGADDHAAHHVGGVVGAQVDAAHARPGRPRCRGRRFPCGRPGGSARRPSRRRRACARSGSCWCSGSRTGTPAPESRRSLLSGRSRSTTCLMPALTRLEDTPATPRARTAARRAGPGATAPPDGDAGPQPAVVAQCADDLGRGVGRGHAPQRLEQAVHPVVDGGHARPGTPCPGRPGRRRSRARPGPRPTPCGRCRRSPLMVHPGRRRRGRRRPATGRRRRRGRSRGSGRTGTAARSSGRKSSSRQARSMADQTARVLVRCPRRPCSVGSAVITVGSFRCSSLTWTGRRPSTSWQSSA